MGNQLGITPRTQIRTNRQNIRRPRHHADGHKGLRVVVDFGKNQRVDHLCAYCPHEHGVTVRFRILCSLSGDHASGSCLVFNNHGLVQLLAQLLGKEACHQVGDPPCSKRHDQTYWLCRERRCLCRSRRHRQGRPPGHHQTKHLFHWMSPELFKFELFRTHFHQK